MDPKKEPLHPPLAFVEAEVVELEHLQKLRESALKAAQDMNKIFWGIGIALEGMGDAPLIADARGFAKQGISSSEALIALLITGGDR